MLKKIGLKGTTHYYAKTEKNMFTTSLHRRMYKSVEPQIDSMIVFFMERLHTHFIDTISHSNRDQISI